MGHRRQVSPNINVLLDAEIRVDRIDIPPSRWRAVRLRRRDHVVMTDSFEGWVGWGPGGPSRDVPLEVRKEVLRGEAEHKARRGRLVARVEVEVYESGECLPQVAFPPGGVLTPTDDGLRIAEMVRAARDALDGWR
jgi:hypothetical protein